MKRFSAYTLLKTIGFVVITLLGLGMLWKIQKTEPNPELAPTTPPPSPDSNNSNGVGLGLIAVLLFGLGIIWSSNMAAAANNPELLRFQVATATFSPTFTITRTPTNTPTVRAQLQTTLVAGDADNDDSFGVSTSISGDTIVVGAPYDDHSGFSDAGSAYVYFRTGSTWSSQGKLTADDPAAGDLFGYSVAISGDTIVVGAYADDNNGNASGSAYVFVRSGTTWTQQQKLVPADNAANDAFGWTVAIFGETIVVGAYGDDTNGNSAGAVYVYVRSGSTWTQQQELLASGMSNSLGYSLDIHAETVVAGAVFENAAYVFVRDGTTWTQQQRLTPTPAVNDSFGNSVAIYDNTIIVGAPDTGTGPDELYGYQRTGTTWTQIWRRGLTPRDNAYGWSVDLYRGVGIVGQIWATATGGAARVGIAVSVVEYSSTHFYFTPDNPAFNDLFGYSVSRDGWTIVITRPNGDPSGLNNAGAAYVYTIAGPPWEAATPSPTRTPTITPTPTAVTISENEFFEALVAARQNYPDIITIVPDFVPNAINMTVAVSGGEVGNVSVEISQGQGFVIFTINAITVNGAAAPASFVTIVNRDLPNILTTALDNILTARFGSAVDINTVSITADALYIAVSSQP